MLDLRELHCRCFCSGNFPLKDLRLKTREQTGEKVVSVDHGQEHGTWNIDFVSNVLTITWSYKGLDSWASEHVYKRVPDTNNWMLASRNGHATSHQHILMLIAP